MITQIAGVQTRRRFGLNKATLIMLLPLAVITSAVAESGSQKNVTPMEDTDAFPITVEATPALVVIQSKDGSKFVGKVRISGTTMPLGSRPVSVEIRSEEYPPVTREVVPGEDGEYSFTEFAPLEAGDYEITATAPDGKGEATTTVVAIEIEALEDKLDTVLSDAVAAAEEGIAAAELIIREQAESPAKQETKKKIESARKAIAELNASRPVWSPAMRGVLGAIASDGTMAEIARPGIDNLAGSIESMEAETRRVRELTSGISGASLGCHQLAVVTEVFKTISALLNVKKSIIETVSGLAKDVISDVVSNKAKARGAGPTYAFAQGQIVKNLPELDSASKLAGNAYSIMTDLGAFATDQVFSAYCEQFVGPISAKMAAEFMWDTGHGLVPYWSYHYQITGRIILYYPKSAAGDSVHLKGRIEGYAHGFTTWEDSLTVQFPQLMAGAIQSKRNWPPLEIGAAAAKAGSQGQGSASAYIEGSAGGLVAPNSFLINVDALMEKDSMSIVIGDVVSDFKASHRVGVLITSPLTGGLGPQFTWYELSFLGARHVFTRGINDQPLKLKLDTSGKVMTAEGSFPHKIQKEKSKAQYLIDVKACNPGC